MDDNEPMRIPTLALLAPLLVAIPLGSMGSEPVGAGRRRPCADAQVVDGELRCDEERLVDSREVCPFGVVRALRSGDAIDRCRVGRMPPDELAALQQRVDLNTASVEELASLPGVGPVIAARIVAARPFRSVDSLDAVSGIGPVKLAGVRARASVSRPR